MALLSRMLPSSCKHHIRYAVFLQNLPFSAEGRRQYNTGSRANRTSHLTSAALVTGGAVATWGLFQYFGSKNGTKALSMQRQQEKQQIVCGEFKKDLPVFSMDEVTKHSTRDQKIWVTFGQGVYDITEFVDKHPGGDKILMAAGGSVEPFWMLYGIHKNRNVLEMLEEYRIGNLSVEEAHESILTMEDPYAWEPKRHPALKPSSMKPYNAEPPLSLLVESFITPSELFYVRNHLPVPDIDAKDYELEITGVGIKTMTLTLEDLKTKFPKYTITATIQCAGNRRGEMVEVKPVKGLNWGQAAIGNGTWSGARLYDVLKAAGLKENQPGVDHIQFEGLDADVSNVPYGASIPIEKAMDPNGDVLLAYEMNGEPLPRDHGYPVRVVVPGIVGARNVKWLGRIVISSEESSSHWQQNDYKGFSPSVDWHNVDFSSAPAIQELPVVSAICDPMQGENVHLLDGKMIVRGYAWSGGGRKIVRVDVTADQGKTWHVADFTHQDTKSKHSRHWPWTLWKAEIPIPKGTKKVEVWAKAVDSSYNVQPESFENIWNLRGVLSNAYHRVKVNIT